MMRLMQAVMLLATLLHVAAGFTLVPGACFRRIMSEARLKKLLRGDAPKTNSVAVDRSAGTQSAARVDFSFPKSSSVPSKEMERQPSSKIRPYLRMIPPDSIEPGHRRTSSSNDGLQYHRTVSSFVSSERKRGTGSNPQLEPGTIKNSSALLKAPATETNPANNSHPRESNMVSSCNTASAGSMESSNRPLRNSSMAGAKPKTLSMHDAPFERAMAAFDASGRDGKTYTKRRTDSTLRSYFALAKSSPPKTTERELSSLPASRTSTATHRSAPSGYIERSRVAPRTEAVRLKQKPFSSNETPHGMAMSGFAASGTDGNVSGPPRTESNMRKYFAMAKKAAPTDSVTLLPQGCGPTDSMTPHERATSAPKAAKLPLEAMVAAPNGLSSGRTGNPWRKMSRNPDVHPTRVSKRSSFLAANERAATLEPSASYMEAYAGFLSPLSADSYEKSSADAISMDGKLVTVRTSERMRVAISKPVAGSPADTSETTSYTPTRTSVSMKARKVVFANGTRMSGFAP